MQKLLDRWIHRPLIRQAPRQDPADTTDTLEAWIHGKVVGRIVTTRHERSLFIHEIKVLPPWRGRGIGRKLVRAAFYRSQVQGLQQAYLMSLCDAGFWALQGFRPLGLEDPSEVALLHPYLSTQTTAPGKIMSKAVPPLVPFNPFR